VCCVKTGRKITFFALLCFLCFLIPIAEELTTSVVWWSEFLAIDPETLVRFPALPDFLKKKKKKRKQ
jgi:hypothetical protein